ncbi:MAG: hypothetical protein DM484_23325, partial [Candidatus Methylumidiphilus alinenensis]
MNRFPKNKLYCALWVAMNLACVERVEALTGASVGGIANTNLTLDGTIKGFNSNLGAGLRTQPVQTFSGVSPTIDAKSYGVFSSHSVFFSFSSFVIDRNSTATFSCSSGFCAGTSNVISRVNSPTNQAEIYGNLTSTIPNTAFYLLSPNGVVIGKNATIDVPGALHIGTTSSLKFSDGSSFGPATADVSTLTATPQAFGFLSTNTITLGADDKSGKADSTLTITSVGPAELSAGNVVDVDPGVGNTNTLNANTAGNTLAIEAGGPDGATSAITINNRNTISETSGGNIGMEANEGTITQAGTISANSSTGSGGDITLTAANGIANTGTIDASGNAAGGNVTLALTPAPAQQLQQTGSVTQTASVFNSAPGPLVYQGGTIHADSTTGLGGQVVLSGEYLQLDNGSLTTATGAAGGGAIYAGGGLHGSPLPSMTDSVFRTESVLQNATYTRVEQGAVLDASATNNGNGGTIVAWGDSASRAYGTFNAKGGPNGGNGGMVETSGHWLDVTGIKVDASAAQGKGGEWLLDPYDVTISTAETGNGNTTTNAGTETWTPTASGSNINNGDINNALINNNATITTGGNGVGNQNGDITVNAPISWTTNNTLSLQADGNISQGPVGIITANAGTLSGSAGGTVNLGGANAIANLGAFTSNGAFTLNNTTGLNVTGAVNIGGGATASNITSSGNLTVQNGGQLVGTNGTLNIETTVAGGVVNVLSGGVITNAALVKSDQSDIDIAGTVSATTTSAGQNITVNGALDSNTVTAGGNVTVSGTGATLTGGSGGVTAGTGSTTGTVGVSAGGVIQNTGNADFNVTGKYVSVDGSGSSISATGSGNFTVKATGSDTGAGAPASGFALSVTNNGKIVSGNTSSLTVQTAGSISLNPSSFSTNANNATANFIKSQPGDVSFISNTAIDIGQQGGISSTLTYDLAGKFTLQSTNSFHTAQLNINQSIAKTGATGDLDLIGDFIAVSQPVTQSGQGALNITASGADQGSTSALTVGGLGS